MNTGANCCFLIVCSVGPVPYPTSGVTSIIFFSHFPIPISPFSNHGITPFHPIIT